jgi:hypothetical protein
MNQSPVRKSNPSSWPEPSIGKKPTASVKEAQPGDFVSIYSRAFLQDKLEEIANLANEASAADGVAIALREGDRFVCRASIGFAPEPGVAVEPGQGVCGQCLAESRLVLSQDLPGEVRSALAAPVVMDGEVQGLIAAFSFRSGAFAASHSELLCCLASDIVRGLESPDSIHLVSGGLFEDSAAAEPEAEELEPGSRDKRLSILQAVTAPALPSLPVLPSALGPEPSKCESSFTSSAPKSPSHFQFTSYADAPELSAFESGEFASSGRPFRNRWDVVVILAAVIIAVLTFGLWLRHHRSQPYTGQIINSAPRHTSLPSTQVSDRLLSSFSRTRFASSFRKFL